MFSTWTKYSVGTGVAAAQGIHILAMHIPWMQSMLQTEPLPWSEWLVPLVIASSVLIVMEIFKAVKRARPAPTLVRSR